MRSPGYALTGEVARLQACTILRGESIGDNLPVPHLLGDPAAGTVQHRTDITSTISTDPVDFQGEAIIQPPAHRSAAYSHTVNLAIISYNTDAEFAANGSPVMSVKMVYVIRCLSEGYGCNLHLLTPLSVCHPAA